MITLTPVSLEDALEGVRIAKRDDQKIWVVVDLDCRDELVAAIILTVSEDVCGS